jgi:hypothetical protein
MDESRTVKAKFEEIVSSEVTLTMQVNPEGIGQTYPEVGTHTYEKNDVVQVIAYAPQGYFFAYWEGGAADSTAPETTVILDEDRTLTAHFSVSDTSPPVLKNCYPGPGSQCVPHNTKIEFSIKYKESGTDLHHLNVWVNGMVIIENGEDQTGGYTLITAHYEAKRIKYFPPEPFEAGSAVTVRVQIPDLAVPPNLCDSTYFFTTSSANIDTSDATSIGQQGGTVSDPVTGIEMEIPAEALQDTVEITITQVDDIPPLPDGLQGLAAPAHFGPDGLQFQIPISVRIPYTQADLDSAGIESPEMLRIYYYHTSTGEWMELTIAHVDTENRIVTVTVQEFCYLTFGQSDATDAEDPLGKNIHADNFLLSQNYPNPFNPETQITYEIAKPCRVSLSVFDTNGRLIKSLIQGEKIPGKYILMWDATSTTGNKVPSGLYLLVMKAGDYHAVRKMSLLK